MSLIQHPHKYKIYKDNFVANALTISGISYSKRHFEMVKTSSGKVAASHVALGIIELLPVIGAVVAIFERIIASRLKKKKIKVIPLVPPLNPPIVNPNVPVEPNPIVDQPLKPVVTPNAPPPHTLPGRPLVRIVKPKGFVVPPKPILAQNASALPNPLANSVVQPDLVTAAPKSLVVPNAPPPHSLPAEPPKQIAIPKAVVVPPEPILPHAQPNFVPPEPILGPQASALAIIPYVSAKNDSPPPVGILDILLHEVQPLENLVPEIELLNPKQFRKVLHLLHPDHFLENRERLAKLNIQSEKEATALFMEIKRAQETLNNKKQSDQPILQLTAPETKT